MYIAQARVVSASIKTLFAALAYISTQAFAQTETPSARRWNWVAVEASGESATGWTTTSGSAAVQIFGRRFHADLWLNDNPSRVYITLDGVIDNGRLRAKEVLLNTDATPANITGALHSEALGQRLTEQRIVFHGGQSGDASFLGLYRRVK